MKYRMILPIVLALGWSGCARFTTRQIDISDEKTQTRTITTKATATTFLAGKTALANWKATQTDKTQGATVGGLSQETDGTKMLNILETVTSGVVKGMRP